MSKTKSTSKAGKRAEPDLLTKVKDAAVTKPAQTIKAKSKELAKQVIGNEDKSKSKKDKKKAKEPTPEPSESEDSESAASSESESEEETAKPVAKGKVNGKANGVKKPAPKEESSDESDSESSASSESEAEVEAPKVNGAAKKAKATETKAEASSDDSDASDSDESMAEAKADSSDEDSDGSSDESSEDEKPAKKAAPKAVEAKKPTKAAKADSDSDSDSDEGSDSSEDEEETAAKPSKRKAEDEEEPAAKKTKTAAVDTSKGSNLFVGNLSWNVDEAWLREIFEEFGELSGVRLMTDRDSGRSKGFGYVEFVNAEDAAKAHAAKAGADVDGRAMNVDYANARPDNSQKQENRRKSYGDQVSEASDTLFLGNLSFEVGQETVTEAFAPHGTILGIRLPTDRETGQPKGFGYVTFSSVDEAKIALDAMQGAYIEGRPVRLDYSSPRPQGSDSPARGRGGFGGRGGAGGRGGRGGRGGNFGGRGGRGGRGGARGGSTNRGGFGDYSGRKTSFD